MKYTILTLKEFSLYLGSIEKMIDEQNTLGGDRVFVLARIANLPCSFRKYVTILKDPILWAEITATPLIMEFYKEHPEVENFFSGHVILHIVYALQGGNLVVTMSVIQPGDISSPRKQLTMQRCIHREEDAIRKGQVQSLYWLLADADLLSYAVHEIERDCLVIGDNRS